MIGNTNIVLEWTGVSEGGHVDHPEDPGGATNLGVTQRVFSAWLIARGERPRDVISITKAEAEAIFLDQYFRPVWFDKLPSGLDYAMADYSINSGPGRAIRELQGILRVKQDGIMGVMTMAAVARRDTRSLITDLCNRRMAFLRALPHWPTFGRGWTRRVMGDVDGVQTYDIGVIDRAIMLAGGTQHIPGPLPSEGKATPVDNPFAALVAFILGIIRRLRA